MAVGLVTHGTGVAIAVSAMVAEPRRSTPDHVAVGRRDGHLVVFGCVAGGIGRAAVSRGARIAGDSVWSVRLTSGSTPLKVVPIETQLAGYEVNGGVLAPGSSDEFNLHGLTDAVGRPLLDSVLTFRPSEIRLGFVKPARDHQQRLDEWAMRAGCQ
jgi:hypothetical protein